MAIFNGYVSLPEGNAHRIQKMKFGAANLWPKPVAQLQSPGHPPASTAELT